MDQNLTIPEGVEAYMASSTSERDWNSRCNDVKQANGGDYPPFWFEAIVLSGLMARAAATWQ